MKGFFISFDGEEIWHELIFSCQPIQENGEFAAMFLGCGELRQPLKEFRICREIEAEKLCHRCKRRRDA